MSRITAEQVAALSPAAVAWLASGEHGASSEYMFHRLLLNRERGVWQSYPLDPGDFRRCELLRRQVPEIRERLPLMAAVRPEWSALVAHWDEIAELIEEEAPGAFEYPGRRWGSAPRAYALMSKIEREAQESTR